MASIYHALLQVHIEALKPMCALHRSQHSHSTTGTHDMEIVYSQRRVRLAVW